MMGLAFCFAAFVVSPKEIRPPVFLPVAWRAQSDKVLSLVGFFWCVVLDESFSVMHAETDIGGPALSADTMLAVDHFPSQLTPPAALIEWASLLRFVPFAVLALVIEMALIRAELWSVTTKQRSSSYLERFQSEWLTALGTGELDRFNPPVILSSGSAAGRKRTCVRQVRSPWLTQFRVGLVSSAALPRAEACSLYAAQFGKYFASAFLARHSDAAVFHGLSLPQGGH